MSVIVITGGSRGIGASTAIECARRGMSVILTYNSNPVAAESVVRTVQADGGNAVALELDVCDVGSFGVFREAVAYTLASSFGQKTCAAWSITPVMVCSTRLKPSPRHSSTAC